MTKKIQDGPQSKPLHSFLSEAGMSPADFEARLRRQMRRQIRAQRHKFEARRKRPRRGARLTPPTLPLPGWNERRMTEADFRRACEREIIVVLRLPIPGTRGAYTRMRGVPTIMIDSRLMGNERLAVMFHELGHYFMHDGAAPLKLDGEFDAAGDWHEAEADAAATIALAPKTSISKVLRQQLMRTALPRSKGRGKGGAK
jgi:hypothetical protein